MVSVRTHNTVGKCACSGATGSCVGQGSSVFFYCLRTGNVSSSFFRTRKINQDLENLRRRKSWCKTSQYNSSSQWLTVSQTLGYSLCVEPIGEREAGDSSPPWPNSMECFLFRDWLLAGGGVGHLSRPLVVCELYGLPDLKKKERCWDIHCALPIDVNRKFWLNSLQPDGHRMWVLP